MTTPTLTDGRFWLYFQCANCFFAKAVECIDFIKNGTELYCEECGVITVITTSVKGR